jgi:hypothetical protein
MPLIFLSASAPRASRKRAGHELAAEDYSICQMTAPPSWKPSLPQSRAAPRTELARLSSACSTSGAVPPSTNTTFPPKPPRMRWATYNRLEAQYDDLENRWALGIMTKFAGYRWGMGPVRQECIRCCISPWSAILLSSADRTRAVPIGSPVQSQMADFQANGF